MFPREAESYVKNIVCRRLSTTRGASRVLMVRTQFARTCALLHGKRQTASKLKFCVPNVTRRNIWIDSFRKSDASAELESIQKAQECIELEAKQTHQKCFDQYREWFNVHRANIIPDGKALSWTEFQIASKRICEHIRQQETQCWNERPKIGCTRAKENNEEGKSEENAYVDAIHLTILRHRLTQLLKRSEGTDGPQEAVSASEFRSMIESLVMGNYEVWLKFYFRLRDSDHDQKLTKEECTQLVDDIISGHKEILNEIISSHVNLPKAAERSLNKSMMEETWRSKFAEKSRSVWHFAQPLVAGENQEKVTALDYGVLLESQQKEFPELPDLTNVFAKGFHKDRVLYYQERSDRWITRRNGMFIIIALSILDYAATLV
uniref:Uncharacterized protein AlNc14C296G10308 n=1 Tax=Albugo laibachii Nc14 TaxID=890382 RepID=F0WVH3_9STRA|nr:conserved hypothetical protein [Albugo laibachii Nc14]|eukprot:CCA25414.1 conserved hypothetical protein [Albugo laibachii Nc14]